MEEDIVAIHRDAYLHVLEELEVFVASELRLAAEKAHEWNGFIQTREHCERAYQLIELVKTLKKGTCDADADEDRDSLPI